jgi:hypothetical protein
LYVVSPVATTLIVSGVTPLRARFAVVSATASLLLARMASSPPT